MDVRELSPEQRAALTAAAHQLSAASGTSVASCVERLLAEPDLLDTIADQVAVLGGEATKPGEPTATSGLANDIRELADLVRAAMPTEPEPDTEPEPAKAQGE